MNKDLRQEIKFLQDEIKENERKIQQAMANGDFDSIPKYTTTIHSDLKYLNIIVNGAPIDLKESRQIMDFIRIHYENLWRIPAHV